MGNCCKRNIVTDVNISLSTIEGRMNEEAEKERYVVSYNVEIPYNFKSLINSGGFGNIFLARNYDKQTKFVQKQGRIRDIKRTLDEAKALIDLKGLYTPKFLRYQKYEDCTILSMEYIEGEDLYEYIEKNWISISLANIIIYKIINAVHYLFLNGYQHLDIKLENIIYNDRTNRITLVDLGAVHKKINKKTQILRNVGTKEYIAPEIFLNYYHPTSDIYSIGCLYWIILTGVFPYAITHRKKGYFQINKEFPPSYNLKRFLALNIPQKTFLIKTLKKNCKERITFPQLLKSSFMNNYINNLNLISK